MTEYYEDDERRDSQRLLVREEFKLSIFIIYCLDTKKQMIQIYDPISDVESTIDRQVRRCLNHGQYPRVKTRDR